MRLVRGSQPGLAPPSAFSCTREARLLVSVVAFGSNMSITPAPVNTGTVLKRGDRFPCLSADIPSPLSRDRCDDSLHGGRKADTLDSFMTENTTIEDGDVFSYREGKDQRVFISWYQRQVMILKGKDATRFLSKIAGLSAPEQQLVMAKLTGNFKRGNERTAKEKHRR